MDIDASPRMGKKVMMHGSCTKPQWFTVDSMKVDVYIPWQFSHLDFPEFLTGPGNFVPNGHHQDLDSKGEPNPNVPTI